MSQYNFTSAVDHKAKGGHKETSVVADQPLLLGGQVELRLQVSGLKELRQLQPLRVLRLLLHLNPKKLRELRPLKNRNVRARSRRLTDKSLLPRQLMMV